MPNKIDLLNRLELREKELIKLKAEKNETIKDYSDYVQLLNELDNIIANPSEEDKKQIESYKDERKLYLITINASLEKMANLSQKIASTKLTSEEIGVMKLYEARKDAVLKMDDILNLSLESAIGEKTLLTNYDGKTVNILKKYEEEFVNTRTEFYNIDKSIDDFLGKNADLEKGIYETQEDILDNISVNYEMLFNEVPVDDYEKLQHDYHNVLDEILRIEQISGKKRHINLSIDGKTVKKDIVKNKAWEYISLSRTLSELEKELKSLSNGTMVVKFDEELFNSMSESQKLQYIANLLLQIENMPLRFTHVYIKETNKMIPVEYKELYYKLLKRMRNINKCNQHETPLSLVAKKEYYEKEICSLLGMNYRELLRADQTKIKEKIGNIDIKNLDNLLKNYDNTLIQMKNEISRLNDKEQNLLEDKNNLVTVNINGEEIAISKDNLSDYSKVHAKKEKFCLALREQLSLDGVMLFENDTDIKLDDSYIDTLDISSKKAYYLLKLNDIVRKSNEVNKMNREIDGDVYQYDSIYDGLVLEITKRMQALKKENEEVLVVQKKERPKFLTKLKRDIKKKTVQVGIGLGILLSSFGLAKIMSTTVNDKTVNIVREYNDDIELKKEEVNVNGNYEILGDIDIIEDKNVLGETFTINDGAYIYSNYQSEQGLRPMYMTDNYTTIGVLLETKEHEKIVVNYNTADAKQVINDILNNGGSIIARQAVASTGINDFLKTGIPTGIFMESDISKNQEPTILTEMINESLNKERAR